VESIRDARKRFQASLSSISAPAASSADPLGWARNVGDTDTARAALNSSEAFSDISEYYRQRDGKTFSNHDEAVDYFMSDRRWRNNNSISLARDLYDVNTQSDMQGQRLARLQTVFDQLPNFYEEGGSGVAGLAENVAANVLDPINLVGFGSGGAAAKSAVAAARVGAARLGRGEATRIGVTAAVKAGARDEALASGITEAGFDYGIQNRNVALGTQDEVSLTQAATAGLVGAAISAPIGGVMGAAGAVLPNPMNRTTGLGGRNSTILGAPTGNMQNNIQAGLRQGVDTRRADSAALRVDEQAASAAARGITDPSGDSILDDIKTLHSNLSDPEVDTVAAEARINQELPVQLADGEQAPARIKAPQDRLAEQISAYELRKSQAEMFRQRAAQISTEGTGAPTSGDATKAVSRIQSESRVYADAANNAERDAAIIRERFQKIVNGQVEIDTPDVGVDAAVATAQRTQQIDTNQVEAVRQITYDPNGPASTGTMPDGSPTRAQTPYEAETTRLRDAAIMPSLKGQEFRPTGGEAATDVAPVADAPDAAPTPVVDNRDSIAKLQTEADALDGEVATLSNQIKGLKNRATRQRNVGNEQAAADFEAQVSELDTRRSEAVSSAKAKRAEAQTIEERYAQRNAMPSEPEVSVEAADVVAATPSKSGTVIGADASDTVAEVASEPVLSQEDVLSRTLGEAYNAIDALLAGANGGKVETQVEFLTGLGYDAKEMKAVLRTLGDGRKRAGREARAKFMRDAVRKAVVDVFLSDTIDAVAASDPAMAFHANRMLATIDTFPEAIRAEATDAYYGFVRQQALEGLILPRLEAHNYNFANVVDEISSIYGDEIGAIASDILALSDDGFLQFAGIPKSSLDKILAELPADAAARVTAMQEKVYNAMLQSGQMSEAKALEVARKIAIERAETEARNVGNSFVVDNAVVDGNIQRLKSAQEALRTARQEMNGVFATTRSERPKVTRSEKVRRDEKVQGEMRSLLSGRNQEDLTGQERVKLLELRDKLETTKQNYTQFLFEAGEGKTEAEAIAANARAKQRELYAAFSIPADVPIGTAIDMLERRVSRVEAGRGKAQRVDAPNQVRLSRDISVGEGAAGNATHMGKTQRQGYGSYTQNGRVVEGGAPTSVQSVLRKSNSFGYTGKLLRSRRSVDANGQTVRENAIVTSLMETLEAQRLKNSKNRMTADAIKRQRSIDAFEADTTGRAFDVVGHEAAIDDIQKADNRVKSAQRALDRNAKPEAADTLSGKLDEAMAALSETINKAKSKGFVTAGEIEASSGNPVAAIKRKMEQYVRSTEQEASANVEEEVRKNLADTIRTKEIAARGNRIAAEMRDLLSGRRAEDLSGKELETYAKLRDDFARLTVELKSEVRSADAASRSAMKPMKSALRAERAARRNAMAENIMQSRLSDGEISVMTEEDWARFYGEPVDPTEYAEDLASAQLSADKQMRLASAEKSGQEAINSEALMGKSRAELQAMVADLQSKLKRIQSNDQQPDQPPASAKYPPYIRKVDGIEIDVNNDFKFIKGETGTSVRFDDVELGVIKRLPDDAGVTFEKLADASPNVSRDIRLFQDANQVRDFIAREFIGRVKEKQAGTQLFDETPDEIGYEYTVPWNDSGTYAGEAQRSVVAEQISDPINDPQVLGRADDLMSQTEDNFDIPAGKRLAVQFVDPNQKTFGTVRVPVGKQSLGQVLKASASHEFTIGYVDAQFKSGSAGAQRTFRPLSSDDVMVPFNSRVPVRSSDFEAMPSQAQTLAQSPRARVNKPLSLDALHKKPIEAGAEFKSPVPEWGVKLSEMRSVADLHNYLLRLENIDFGRLSSPKLMDEFIAHRIEVGQAMQRHAPQGVQKIDQTMRSAEGQLREIMGSRAPEEIESAIGFLMRVSGLDSRRVPLMTTATGRPAYAPAAAPTAKNGASRVYPGTQINDDNVGRIILGDDALNAVDASGRKYLPTSATLVHETGHWIYQNLLDESDKLAFWQAMRKFVNESGVDFAALKRGSGAVFDNELASPAEFFANQFMAYTMKTNQIDMSIWKKVAKMAVTLLRRIVRGEEDFEIDADILPIFMRHMPPLDVDPETGLLTGGVSRFAGLEEVGKLHGKPSSVPGATMNQAQFKGRQLAQLDEVRAKALAALHVGVTSGDSLRLATSLEEVAAKLYGLYGGKTGTAQHKTTSGREGASGFSRMYSSDRSPTARIVNAAQADLYAFINQLKDAGFEANRSAVANGRTSLLPDGMEVSAVNSIYDTIENQTRSLDGGAFEADAMAAASIRKAGLDGLDREAMDHLRRLGRNVLYALEKDIKSKLSEFNKAMPRSARGAGVMVRLDGSAFTTRGNQKSQRYMRLNAAQAAQEKATVEAAQSIVDALNQAGLRDVLSDLTDEQLLDMGRGNAKSPRKMTSAELLAGINVQENAARSAELANELRSRNMPILDLTKVMAELTDDQAKIVAFARQSEANSREALNQALMLGDPRMIEITSLIARENWGVENPVAVTSPKVSKAVELSDALNSGVLDEDGLDASLPSGLRDYANLVTHRNPKIKDKIGRLFTNMMHHLYSEAELTGAEPLMLTPYDAAQILGRSDLDNFQDDVALPTDSDLYNNMRGAFRSVAASLEQGRVEDAVDFVSNFGYSIMSPSEQGAFSKIGKASGISGREMHNALLYKSLRGQLLMDNFRSQNGGETLARLVKESQDRVIHVLRDVRDGSSSDGFVMFAAYGDIYAAMRRRTPFANAAFSVSKDSVHPSIAARVAREIVGSMSPSADKGARRFLGVDDKADLTRSVYHVVTEEGEVRGVTQTESGVYGRGVYLKRKADDGYDAMGYKSDLENSISKDAASPDMARAGLDAAKEIISLRERLLQVAARGAGPDEIQSVLQSIKANWAIAKAASQNAHSKDVMPVFARLSDAFDVSSKSKYTLGAGNVNIDHLLVSLMDNGLVSRRGLESLQQNLPSSFSGRQLYEALTSDVGGIMHLHGDSIDGVNARDRLNQHLRDNGYDSIITDEGAVAFDMGSVRPLQDRFNDFAEMEGRPASYGGKTSIDVLEEMSFNNAPIRSGASVAITVDLQNAGVPEAIIKPVRKMLKGRELSSADVERVNEFSSVRNFFSENSVRLRKMGANWFADVIKPTNGAGVQEAHSAEMGRVLASVLNGTRKGDVALNTLPDATNYAKRWMNRNKFWGSVAQPASHRRILDAIRQGRAAVANLKPDERIVAYKIVKSFDEELKRMKDMGIHVGDARGQSDFYLPQVWNIEAIRDNPSAFIESMTRVFMREQATPDFTSGRESVDAIKGRVEKMVQRMLDTDGDFVNAIDSARTVMSDPFYSRIIRLQPGDYKDIDGFMVNDLEGLIVKYFDRTARKRVLTERIGVNGHALLAYERVAEGGIEAAADILSQNKISANTKQGTRAGFAAVEDVTVPRIAASKETITRALTEAKRILADKKNAASKSQARNILVNLQDAAFRTEPQFLKRVDAIVNAMSDFNSRPISRQALSEIAGMNNLLNRRPIEGNGTGMSHVVTRRLKAFNSVTLLGFTTLTSIPDTALPLIRSGNFGAFAKAWKNYMADPDYRRASKNLGVGIDNLLHQKMAEIGGEGSQRFSNAFFNFTMLTGWTNVQREVGAMVGYEAMRAELGKATRLRREGKTNSASYRTSMRFLERYGLTGQGASYDFMKPGAVALDVSSSDGAAHKAVQLATLRFVNESLFMPSSNDIPQWANTPWGSVVFQLKSYPLMMMRLTNDVFGEAKKGNMKPLAYLATAGVGFGAIALSVKDVVQSRGGDDNRQREVRERRLSQMFPGLAAAVGIPEDSNTDAALGWYLQSMMAVGGIGLLGDFFFQAAEQADNGAYGQTRMMSYVLGPSASLIPAAMDVAGGVSEAAFGGTSPGKTRQALRTVAGRVPILGGVGDFRETAADLGGDPTGTKTNTGTGSSFSSGFGSGFKNGF